MTKSSKPTKLDLLLGDLTDWNDEARQQARTYIDGHCARFHLVWLVGLAGHDELNDGWPSRAELLEVVNLVGPQELLRANCRASIVRHWLWHSTSVRHDQTHDRFRKVIPITFHWQFS
jgi:hypothetical protein